MHTTLSTAYSVECRHITLLPHTTLQNQVFKMSNQLSFRNVQLDFETTCIPFHSDQKRLLVGKFTQHLGYSLLLAISFGHSTFATTILAQYFAGFVRRITSSFNSNKQCLSLRGGVSKNLRPTVSTYSLIRNVVFNSI